MRKLYTAGALAAAVLALAGCGASASASRVISPTQEPKQQPPNQQQPPTKPWPGRTPPSTPPVTPPVSPSVTPSVSPSKKPGSPGAPGGVVVPPMRTGTAAPTGGAGEACEPLASAQQKQAADAITIPTTAQEAQQQLAQLQQMGLYRPDLVAYSDDQIEAVKQVKDRLCQGLIGLDGDLAPLVKEMLKTPQPTG